MKFLNLEKLYRENRIFYWNNALGEINLPDDDGLISHTPDELPLFQRDLYENYWCGIGTEYVVTMDGIPVYVFCFLLEDEYASDLGITPETLHMAARGTAKSKFVGSVFDECAFLFGENADPWGAELMIFLPYSKRENIAMIRAGIASGEYGVVIPTSNMHENEKKTEIQSTLQRPNLQENLQLSPKRRNE